MGLQLTKNTDRKGFGERGKLKETGQFPIEEPSSLPRQKLAEFPRPGWAAICFSHKFNVRPLVLVIFIFFERLLSLF